MKKRPVNAVCFGKVPCYYNGMYGDCNNKDKSCKDKNGVCIYTDSPAAPYCMERLFGDDTMEAVGSVEGIWKYAHPHDVGIFLDGTYGWFLRHEEYLDWDINKLKKWLADKPANVYRPTKGKVPKLVVRRDYVRKGAKK